MKLAQGSWRKDENGKYKVFVGGKEEREVGTVVEVHTRYGNPDYVVIKGIHSKFKGGYLYDFKYTSKPKILPTLDTNLPKVSPLPSINVGIKPEVVSPEDLDKALGLD